MAKDTLSDAQVRQELNLSAGEVKEAVRVSREMITKGSKSFSLAARLFNKESREAAFCLYGWCRYCDDQVDGSDLGFRDAPQDASRSKEESLKIVENLKRQVKAAYAGEKMETPVFTAFQVVVKKFRIPEYYPMELLEGMAMDVRGESYSTINDLMVYCYRVAGVVGLMMSHVMGVTSEKALLHAASMGKAMQLTNISRDIKEDAEMGRIYIPLDWLESVGLKADPKELADPASAPKLAKAAKKLLAVADVLYMTGDRGIKYLPFSAACSIASARRVYAEIGKQVRRRGSKAWDTRTTTSLGRKLFVMLLGISKVLLTLPKRFRRSAKPIQIETIWRNT